MSNFLPFALPDICEDEISEVIDSMRSGWLTTGPKTKKFEQDFQDFLGHGVEAIAVNSATAGLHLALEAAGLQAGDEVITTVHTFTATAEVIRYFGADPIFVDIDVKTLNIDLEKVSNAITPKTKVIMPVHFAGLACKMDKLIKIAQSHNIKIIEDAAHALPSSFDGQLVGTFDSVATVFSFYANKTITTGEGGMVVTKNKAIANRIKTMRLHGISRDAFDRFTSKKPAWFYEVVAPGFKYNMTDLAASIGIPQLKKAWLFQKRREELALNYREAFKDLPIILPSHCNKNDIHSWHIYVIRLTLECGIIRDDFIKEMFQRGIGCSVHYIPLHLHPYWKDTYNLKPSDFPISSHVFEHCVTIPLYSKMTDEDQTKVINAVTDILKKSAEI